MEVDRPSTTPSATAAPQAAFYAPPPSASFAPPRTSPPRKRPRSPASNSPEHDAKRSSTRSRTSTPTADFIAATEAIRLHSPFGGIEVWAAKGQQESLGSDGDMVVEESAAPAEEDTGMETESEPQTRPNRLPSPLTLPSPPQPQPTPLPSPTHGHFYPVSHTHHYRTPFPSPMAGLHGGASDFPFGPPSISLHPPTPAPSSPARRMGGLKYTMGPRADCEKCRMGLKGHYGHWA